MSLDRELFKEIMLVLYGVSALSSFVFVPFAYFYGDERLDDLGLNPRDDPQQEIEVSTLKDKVIGAAKNTVFFLVFVMLFMAMCLFFKQADFSIDKVKQAELKWVQELFDSEHFGVQAISYLVSIIGVFGMCLLILYTGYGLGALPFYMIKGTKSLYSAHKEVENDKVHIRDRIRFLQEKISRNKLLSNKEKKELYQLKNKEE